MKKATIPGNDFFKSLGNLEALAKGDLEKAQLFHTSANSDPKGFAGSKFTDVNDDSDITGDDGTDLKVRKSIIAKVKKGIALNNKEIALLKSDVEGMAMAMDDDKDEDKKDDDKDEMDTAEEGMEDEDSDEDKEEDKKEDEEKAMPIMGTYKAEDGDMAAKSFRKSLGRSEAASDAFEVSDFLVDFAKSFSVGLGAIEKRTNRSITKSTNSILKSMEQYLEARFEKQDEFNKAMANAIVGIGNGLAGAMNFQNEVAEQPARGPKSTTMSKGFGGGNEISKSMKLDAMCDLVQKGQLSPLEVTKFEMTGSIRPELESHIMTLIQGGGR